ncbi:hypothetical protein SK128_019222 [Halocaridina rubra]|uniref:Uncharacterized protein n=1 Tax=Halocaridina rubra TaxID=373956 RepID=A0AAN8XCT2_HALRR
MVVLMGIRDEELSQRLISRDTRASLQDVVNCCQLNEANQRTASDIHSSKSQLCTISSYKSNKCQMKKDTSHRTSASGYHEKPPTSHSISVTSEYCQFSTRHGPGKCPTAEHLSQCGYQGHWDKVAKCPTKDSQCHFCSKTGHYDENEGQWTGWFFSKGADVSVIGKQHLDLLRIPRSSLQPQASTTTLTADGSEMASPLGSFQATLHLDTRSCTAKIQVHQAIQTPFLSSAQCQELVIISPDFLKPILENQVKEELNSMVQQGIIKPAGEDSSDWCHPLIVAPKDRGVRMTVDLTHLYYQVSQTTHPSTMLFTTIRSVAPISMLLYHNGCFMWVLANGTS